LPDFHIRPLFGRDFDRGFLELVSQLSPVNLDIDAARAIFITRLQARVYTWVALLKDRPIATASMFIEPKWIHAGGKVAHVEDVVVDSEYRKHGVGRLLIHALEREARAKGCYKMILDCSAEAVAFYERCSFRAHETAMRLNLARVTDVAER
jgi:glucosamine-phosphate N-acetyltransferase